jgi:hypothetical protein
MSSNFVVACPWTIRRRWSANNDDAPDNHMFHSESYYCSWYYCKYYCNIIIHDIQFLFANLFTLDKYVQSDTS